MEKKHLNLTPPAKTSQPPNPDPDSEGAIACDCDMFFGPAGPLHMPGITHMRFEDLTAQVLTARQPGLIVLPLFSAGYDATAAVEQLEALGYRGRITVLAPPLPRPALVERELRALGPGARLVLISP